MVPSQACARLAYRCLREGDSFPVGNRNAEEQNRDGKRSGRGRNQCETERKNADPRTLRSIRFSDPEWARVEWAANERGMTAVVLVHHAAMSLAEDKFVADGALAPGHIALIERIFRTTYIPATLKRDEMTRERCTGEIDSIAQTARALQE